MWDRGIWLMSYLKTDQTMGKATLSLLVICCIIVSLDCPGQVPVKLTEPKLELKDNLLHISYDILNSSPSDNFEVSIYIKDEEGHEITAKTLAGDIGLTQGGGSKRITWDPAADNIFINSKIYIKVNATLTGQPEPASSQVEDVGSGYRFENSKRSDGFYRGQVFIQSALLPGLGMARITGKPHWLKGIATYGCIAGAVVMNRKALDTYAGIDELIEYDDKNALYQEANKQNQYSNLLAYGAIGIWSIEMVWTLIGTSGPQWDRWVEKRMNLSLDSYVDPLNATPMVSVTYTF